MFSCFSQPATGQNDQGQQGPGQLDGLYGFPAPDGLTDAQLADRQHSSASASASAAAWSRLAINKDGIPQLPSSRSQLKKLCRGGIPPHLRAKVWPLISGASKLRQAKGAAYFQQMLQEAERVERLQGTEDGQDKKLHNAIKQIDLVSITQM